MENLDASVCFHREPETSHGVSGHGPPSARPRETIGTLSNKQVGPVMKDKFFGFLPQQGTSTKE